MFPKIGVFPPKWMVYKKMESPKITWMIWGGFHPLFFGSTSKSITDLGIFIARFHPIHGVLYIDLGPFGSIHGIYFTPPPVHQSTKKTHPVQDLPGSKAPRAFWFGMVRTVDRRICFHYGKNDCYFQGMCLWVLVGKIQCVFDT